MGWQDHTTVEYFDGIGALLRRIDELPAGEAAGREGRANEFTGGLSFEEAKRAAIHGHAPLTERVQRVINRIDADQYLTDAPRIFRPAIVGPIVSVPAYLAGLPDCMLEQSGIVGTSQGPVTVCVNVSVSGGIPASTIEKIGAAVCALAMTLQRVRPVEIVVVSTLGSGLDSKWGGIPVLRMGVSPFDADQLSFTLAHAAFLRHLHFQWVWRVKGYDTWIPWAWDLGGKENYREMESRIRELVGASDEWLYVGGAHLTDQAVHANPEKWVRDQIERLTKPAS